VTWLEPYPDTLLEALPDAAPGPERRYETREAVGLAFITALQRLPSRQRAVLVLRDVLGYHAREVAEMLDTSEPTVNSALQRARTALEARLPRHLERTPAPGSTREREIAHTFADAFERGDIERVVSMLTDDAWIKMPPEPYEYQGREAIANFLHQARLRTGREQLLLPTRANGQPAFAQYFRGPGAPVARVSGLLVLTIEGDRISAITRFGTTNLPSHFDLPQTLDDRP
jgi:RNA polymerase sigma-70 factor (ECF subfamily)